MKSEQHLAAACLSLIDKRAVLSAGERALAKACAGTPAGDIERLRDAIRGGADPLGDAFTSLRSPEKRREAGAVYTPAPIVQSMIKWIGSQCDPARVVDPGAGSGRYILASGASFPNAKLIAVETDPLAALMLRANLCARGWADRATVLVNDYRAVKLPECKGPTAFIGNPPYVRHHEISPDWKAWYSEAFARLGIKASGLAGLHLHFFLQTSLLARDGDVGAFVTSAEWLDVNYGSALRKLLLDHLGGIALHVLEPKVKAFPGTATTAAITCFRVTEKPASLRVRSVESLASLNGLTKGTDVPREILANASRWSIIVRPSGGASRGGIELGEMFRVHRGQVTGSNGVWIAGPEAANLPDRVKLPAVTKARDLLMAGDALHSHQQLRRVVDIPAELDLLSAAERTAVSKFLRWAKAQGADRSYIAQHRRAWWAVGLKPAAAILCTYMARRAPQFTLNECGARHINIAHGLYPRDEMPKERLSAVVAWLNENTCESSGRTYAGGLTKFEPKEIERLLVPASLIK